MALVAISQTLEDVYGILWLVALVPVVWAIVDIVRRPSWQISGGRKTLLVAVIAVMWFFLFPVAILYSLMYLLSLRKRLPVTNPGLSSATWDPYRATGPVRPPDLPAPGWYTDPSGEPGERWWDGRGWTDRTRAVPTT